MTRSIAVRSTLLGSTLLLLGLAAPTGAAVFCVDSAVALQDALTAAASNGADDEVRIVQGNYVGNFIYASAEANALSVLGGYTAECATRELDPENSILDGNQTNMVLALSAPNVATELLVEGLTLRNGQRSGEGGGRIATVGDGGAVTVERNRIEGNMASHGGACFATPSTPSRLPATAFPGTRRVAVAGCIVSVESCRSPTTVFRPTRLILTVPGSIFPVKGCRSPTTAFRATGRRLAVAEFTHPYPNRVEI